MKASDVHTVHCIHVSSMSHKNLNTAYMLLRAFASDYSAVVCMKKLNLIVALVLRLVFFVLSDGVMRLIGWHPPVHASTEPL